MKMKLFALVLGVTNLFFIGCKTPDYSKNRVVGIYKNGEREMYFMGTDEQYENHMRYMKFGSFVVHKLRKELDTTIGKHVVTSDGIFDALLNKFRLEWYLKPVQRNEILDSLACFRANHVLTVILKNAEVFGLDSFRRSPGELYDCIHVKHPNIELHKSEFYKDYDVHFYENQISGVSYGGNCGQYWEKDTLPQTTQIRYADSLQYVKPYSDFWGWHHSYGHRRFFKQPSTTHYGYATATVIVGGLRFHCSIYVASFGMPKNKYEYSLK